MLQPGSTNLNKTKKNLIPATKLNLMDHCEIREELLGPDRVSYTRVSL